LRVTNFNTRKLTPVIGIEILDVDVNTLSDQEFAEIRRLWVENLVIFFRDQKLTPAQMVTFSRRFGEPFISYNKRIHHPEFPEIAVLLSDENSKSAVGDVWHTDGSGDPEPPMASLFYMHETPPAGGDTLFASTQKAYDTLSQSMKTYLEGLTAIHDRVHAMRTATGAYAQKSEDNAPVSEHPVVRTHPETGRKGLFVNRAYTSHIVQLNQAESDALLAFLFEHIEQPTNQCRFSYENGSIALWDNRSAHHLAMFDYYPHRRLAHRIMVAGDRPFLHEPAN
jgi:taurine dioxygenase